MKQEAEEWDTSTFQARYDALKDLAEFDLAKMDFGMKPFTKGINYAREEISKHHLNWDLSFLDDIVSGRFVTPTRVTFDAPPAWPTDVPEVPIETST